jgi:hypothetical protein
MEKKFYFNHQLIIVYDRCNVDLKKNDRNIDNDQIYDKCNVIIKELHE